VLRNAFFLWLLLAGSAFSLSAHAADPIAEFPYRVDYEGWVTVSVMVNGKGPYDFVLDSGATITAAFQNLADLHVFTSADREPIRILGLVGSEILPAVNIGDLTIGGQRMDNHVGVVLPDWRETRQTPGGVLGLDFLTRYTVLFDADKQTIRLYDRRDPISELPRSWSKTRMRAENFGEGAGTLYRITASIHGRKVPCIIDLGASGTLINNHALRRLLGGVIVDGTRATGFSTGSRLNDIFDSIKIAKYVRVGTIKIAKARWSKRVFTVFDAPIFEELGVHKKAFCLVGADLMIEHSFIFDFAHEQLYMGPKAKRRKTTTDKSLLLRDSFRAP
jgi:predicted aspartyl protease